MLGARDIAIGRLDQAQQDILYVLANVAGLGQRSRVSYANRDIKDARQSLRQERLARTGRTQQQDIALVQLHIFRLQRRLNAFVVIVDRDAQDAFCRSLPDDVFIQSFGDLPRREQQLEFEIALDPLALFFFRQEIVAKFDAEVADEYILRTGDQPLHIVLQPTAKGTAMPRCRQTQITPPAIRAPHGAVPSRSSRNRPLPARSYRHRGR